MATKAKKQTEGEKTSTAHAHIVINILGNVGMCKIEGNPTGLAKAIQAFLQAIKQDEELTGITNMAIDHIIKGNCKCKAYDEPEKQEVKEGSK